MPFDHPLYVLFSSGTTGRPKAIVHGTGGILLEHWKALSLHHDLGPDGRFFWFSTTGWMMWNYLLSGLATGSSIVTYDGDPAHPDLGELWRAAGRSATTVFGTSAPFLMACRRAGLAPRAEADLGALRQLGSTGAPLPAEGFAWVAEQLPGVQLNSISGGTDVCTAFVGSNPLTPVWEGEISRPLLGVDAAAVGPDGHQVGTGEQGELVIRRPMPSMPVGLWDDPDGRGLRAAYFDQHPGVWSHGDWVTFTERGTCVISGRSDATLNRGGVRIGTAEFYAVVEALPEVADSLVVHLEADDELVLFVVVPDDPFDEALRDRIASTLRRQLSPRHVPDRIVPMPSVPRTATGKKLEVPVKRLLQGVPVADAASRGSLADPASLEPFVAFAAQDPRQ